MYKKAKDDKLWYDLNYMSEVEASLFSMKMKNSKEQLKKPIKPIKIKHKIQE